VKTIVTVTLFSCYISFILNKHTVIIKWTTLGNVEWRIICSVQQYRVRPDCQAVELLTHFWLQIQRPDTVMKWIHKLSYKIWKYETRNGIFIFISRNETNLKQLKFLLLTNYRRKNPLSESKTLPSTKKKKVCVCVCVCARGGCVHGCEHECACVKSDLTPYFSFCNPRWYRWCLNKIHSKSDL
jgi:hypothetical protein